MENVAEIKRSMLATGHFNEKDLDFLTDEYLKDFERNAVHIKLPKPSDGPATAHVFKGNHIVAGGTWKWKSGSTAKDEACGQSVSNSRRAYTGDTYWPGGNCPQGYPWYYIKMWYREELDS